MPRRFHVEQVREGSQPLPREQAHHAKNVLRLKVGDPVELFDDAGSVGTGTISEIADDAVLVHIDTQAHASGMGANIHIASAIPKGSRADWIIEKLSELGVTRFTPLATERAVVLPEGAGKLGRWQRLAEEAARQSGRAGVMQIDPLMPLETLLKGALGFFGSTRPPATPLAAALKGLSPIPPILIGPEGGWSDGEVARLLAGNWKPITLGPTILRVETAAIIAAGIAMHCFDSDAKGDL